MPSEVVSPVTPKGSKVGGNIQHCPCRLIAATAFHLNPHTEAVDVSRRTLMNPQN